MNLDEKLLGMKRKLDRLAQDRDRAKVERDLHAKRLLDEHGLKSVQAAEKAAEKMERDAEALDKELETGIVKIQIDHKELLLSDEEFEKLKREYQASWNLLTKGHQ